MSGRGPRRIRPAGASPLRTAVRFGGAGATIPHHTAVDGRCPSGHPVPERRHRRVVRARGAVQRPVVRRRRGRRPRRGAERPQDGAALGRADGAPVDRRILLRGLAVRAVRGRVRGSVRGGGPAHVAPPAGPAHGRHPTGAGRLGACRLRGHRRGDRPDRRLAGGRGRVRGPRPDDGGGRGAPGGGREAAAGHRIVRVQRSGAAPSLRRHQRADPCGPDVTGDDLPGRGPVPRIGSGKGLHCAGDRSARPDPRVRRVRRAERRCASRGGRARPRRPG